MLIVCPACASEYEIEADRLGAKGRSVRCASCRETWFIAADGNVAAEDGQERGHDGLSFEAVPDFGDADSGAAAPPTSTDVEGEAPGIIDRPMPSARRPKPMTGKPGRLGAGRPLSPALAAGLAALAILPLALLGRASVVSAMPQTAGFFASIGLPVNLRGVAIRDVSAFQTHAEADKPAELVVEGDLLGVARERTDVPELAIEIRDEHGQPLHSWTLAPPRAALENSETARFTASLSAPPARGRSVQVRFAQMKAVPAVSMPAGGVGDEPTAHGAASHEDAAASHADSGHAPVHGH